MKTIPDKGVQGKKYVKPKDMSGMEKDYRRFVTGLLEENVQLPKQTQSN